MPDGLALTGDDVDFLLEVEPLFLGELDNGIGGELSKLSLLVSILCFTLRQDKFRTCMFTMAISSGDVLFSLMRRMTRSVASQAHVLKVASR
jgi:hypothetical protein